jgi:arsenite methyltransferase
VRRDRARYGVDGGYGGIAFFLLVGACLLAGERWASGRDKRLAGSVAKTGIMVVLAVAAGYFYSTGPGKLSVWKGLLDDLDLRGDEHVLDIGCGRGAVLISAAHRLPRGRATGADIWRLRDQTGNSQAAAERNAMVEGVSERVEFADADARDLPLSARVVRRGAQQPDLQQHPRQRRTRQGAARGHQGPSPWRTDAGRR